MTDRLEGISETGVSERLLEALIAEHRRERLPRLETLWRYFRNPLEPVGVGVLFSQPVAGHAVEPPRWRAAQEEGLPNRITGRRGGVRREVVVENDIAWRIQTMIDFLLGKPPRIVSTAESADTRDTIERLLDAVWEASGGLSMLQDAALLGHVHGYVDLLLRLDEPGLVGAAAKLRARAEARDFDGLAGLVRIEPVAPTRGVPVVSDADYRELDAFVLAFERELNEVEERTNADRDPRVARLFGRKDAKPTGSKPIPPGGRGAVAKRRRVEVLEVFGPGVRRLYERGEIVERDRSALLPGVVPVVHVQNLSQPFRYEGLSEVEPLIPLQDELNTRLSDRANRVTLQSFRMYLAKRLDGIAELGVGPGQVWTTDDPDASITAFGGDATCPSETEHIGEIREALDKASAVPPLAGGVVRARIGNLSSANALRVTLLSLLSKTARKRVAYGRGITETSRMVLEALDAAGIVRTRPEDRGLRIAWPEPTPLDPADEVRVAREKAAIGVPEQRVLAELGYGPADAGVD